MNTVEESRPIRTYWEVFKPYKNLLGPVFIDFTVVAPRACDGGTSAVACRKTSGKFFAALTLIKKSVHRNLTLDRSGENSNRVPLDPKSQSFRV